MEKIKKIMLVVGLITTTLLLSAFVNKATERSENETEILTMRVVEATKGEHSAITIVNENGKTEKINLEAVPKGLVTNVAITNKALNSITEKGYKLVATAGSGDNFIIITTYTFVKN